jgi:hypothetical protein
MRRIATWTLLLATSGCQRQFTLAQTTRADVFQQAAPAATDLLLVVDNSYSMAAFQQRLSTGFSALVGELQAAGVDVHLGAVTTSVGPAFRSELNGCSVRDVADSPPPFQLVGGGFLTFDTPDLPAAFADLVQVGVCGDGAEMGMHTAWKVLTDPASVSSGFLREDATLSIVVISDEDDSSPLPPTWYVDDLRERKGLEDRDAVLLSALNIVDPATCTASQAENASIGARYEIAVNATGGVLGDICVEDYQPTLAAISNLTSQLIDTFELSQMPDTTTLTVEVDGVALPCAEGAWTYTRETDDLGEEAPLIRFAAEHRPLAGTEIVVRYLPGSGDPESWCTATEEETP